MKARRQVRISAIVENDDDDNAKGIADEDGYKTSQEDEEGSAFSKAIPIEKGNKSKYIAKEFKSINSGAVEDQTRVVGGPEYGGFRTRLIAEARYESSSQEIDNPAEHPPIPWPNRFDEAPRNIYGQEQNCGNRFGAVGTNKVLPIAKRKQKESGSQHRQFGKPNERST